MCDEFDLDIIQAARARAFLASASLEEDGDRVGRSVAN
jgi:hypothetical protein